LKGWVTPVAFWKAFQERLARLTCGRQGTLEAIDDEATLQRFHRPGLMELLLKGQKVTR
jgi:hypothetical protein